MYQQDIKSSHNQNSQFKPFFALSLVFARGGGWF